MVFLESAFVAEVLGHSWKVGQMFLQVSNRPQVEGVGTVVQVPGERLACVPVGCAPVSS